MRFVGGSKPSVRVQGLGFRVYGSGFRAYGHLPYENSLHKQMYMYMSVFLTYICTYVYIYMCLYIIYTDINDIYIYRYAERVQFTGFFVLIGTVH